MRRPARGFAWYPTCYQGGTTPHEKRIVVQLWRESGRGFCAWAKSGEFMQPPAAQAEPKSDSSSRPLRHAARINCLEVSEPRASLFSEKQGREDS